MTSAVEEILNLSYNSFSKNDYTSARKTEALHLIINQLRDILLTYHFIRLQKGICSIRAISVWAELLLILQRVSDHCSNVSWCVLNKFDNIMKIHGKQRLFRDSEENISDENYKQAYEFFAEKYGPEYQSSKTTIQVL